MKKSLICSLVATAFLISSPAMAGAAKKPSNVGDKAAETPTTQSIGELVMANQLAAYGIANKDSQALITAAKIIKANPTQPSEAKKDGKASGKAVAGTAFTADYLLDQAKGFAGDRKDLLAMIEDVRSQGSRGKVGGAARVIDEVNGRTTDSWPIRFRSGEKATVGVVGVGGVDIDCRVYDENDNLITSDTDSTSVCALSWTPKWTGQFKVKITNPSNSSVEYLMVTN